MRVKPPGDGAPISGLAHASGLVGDVKSAQATEAAREVSAGVEVHETAAVAPASAATGTEAVDPVLAVAQRLRAGEINAREAVELLIDDVVARQMAGAVPRGSALAAELKELLSRHAETDPYLASKVRRMGNRT